MSDDRYARIRSIKDFESLVEYLSDELDWPFDMDVEDIEDLSFEYEPDELGLDKGYEVKVREIKQLRPASGNQPWGIFFVDFETKRLPVTVLRRALRALVPKKRASAAQAHQATWEADDLLFIAATGESGNRGISFAHFENVEDGIPRLKTIAWDESETHFFYREKYISRLRWPDDENETEAWRKTWASAFTTEHGEFITTAKMLSSELARLAQRTRDLILRVYEVEAKDGALHRLHESFRTVLIEDLDENGFADMVAQTISYGLFSARATGESVLGLAHLEAMVPNTNPFLKELFTEFTSLSGVEKNQIDFDELGVSELVDMLDRVNVESVLENFGIQSGGGAQDPVIHFYEDFLAEYDRDQKVQRGVFYTPKPVVSYIVRSVDRVLRDELGCPDGLADTSTMEWRGETWPKVMILDPATGTGTFLETVIEVIHETMTGKWKEEGKKPDEIHAAWNEYVPEHLLPRLHGFELMMAPYSVAHMKLGLKLKETGYEFDSDERLRVFLTNTLEEPRNFSGRLFADFLAHEANAANEIKRVVPVTVIVGNPPYSKNAANRGAFAESLVQPYKVAISGERNVQPLSDDYIKFIGFVQRCLKTSPIGVVSMVTNRGYLGGLLHRGVRQSLLESFSTMYVLDCHGDTNVGETPPEGERNENVFDIQQGVAVSCFVKTLKDDSTPRIFHADLWGTRQEKYLYLQTNSMPSSLVRLKNVIQPMFFFTAFSNAYENEYSKFNLVTKVFGSGDEQADKGKRFGNGIKTNRDSLLLAFRQDDLRERMEMLASSAVTDGEVRQRFKLTDGPYWNTAREREKVRSTDWDDNIRLCLYRPFDFRWMMYQKNLIQIGRGGASPQLMKHLLGGENLALLTSRNPQTGSFSSILCTNLLSEMKTAESTRASYCFPLYVYSTNDLFDFGAEGRKPNLAPEFVLQLSQAIDLKLVSDGAGDLEETFGPEDVFHYAYAVFHSPAYRERYAEFLKRDFPRLPITTDRVLFSELCDWGEELVALHLMRSRDLDNPFATYPKSGSNVMEKAKYDAEERRVYINKEGQYFGEVPENTWNFRVGGYQVLHKWLKDRKDRNLSEEDVEHYRRVVNALYETARIMSEIDGVIESHGGWPLTGSVRQEAGTSD